MEQKGSLRKILLVDDDADSCEAMARMLRLSGHEASCSGNGRQALADVIARPPDFAVVDVRMPEMGGVEFVSVLRSYLRLRPAWRLLGRQMLVVARRT